MAKNQFSEIREWLKQNGFTKAVAENVTLDGTPAVMLRWNGKSHEITQFEIDESYENDKRASWLVNNFADAKLDDSKDWKAG